VNQAVYKPKDSLDRAFDALLSHEIRKLNTHLPKQRRTLGNLLTETNPTLETVGGSTILLKSNELCELANLVPAEYHNRLKLPFVILRRMELGRSVYTISGERIEEFTVKKILGITSDSYAQIYRHREPLFLYRPQVTELLTKFHSLIVIGFGLPKELSDYSPSLA